MLKKSIIALEVASPLLSLMGIIQNENLFLVQSTLFLWVIEGNLELSTYSSFTDLNGCCLHPLGKVMGRRQTPAVAIPGFSEGSDEVHP